MSLGIPKVTIAFPTYNGARFLAEAIDSALAQTHPNVHILQVDDCSADDTVAIASRYGARVAIYRNEHNLGIGANWNRCVTLARDADFVLIVHQDDLISPDLVERALEMMRAHPDVSFVLSRVEQIDDRGHAIDRLRDIESESVVSDQVVAGTGWYERLMQGAMPMWGPVGGVARRALYDQVGLYDESYTFAVDLQMYFRMLLACDVGFLAGPVYRWRRHDHQATARHHKGERYAEVIRAKTFGYELAETSGRFDSRALGRLRRSLADDCCQAARRYALADARYGWHYLRQAWSLRRASALKADFISACARSLWSATLGPTAAGQARYARTNI